MVELIKSEQDYNMALNEMEMLVEDGKPEIGSIEHDALIHITNVIRIYEDTLNPMLSDTGN